MRIYNIQPQMLESCTYKQQSTVGIANIKQQSAIGRVLKKIQQSTIGIGGVFKRYNTIYLRRLILVGWLKP